MYSDCMSVALVIQPARYYIVICGLSDSTILFNIICQMAQFSGKKISYLTWKICLISSTSFVEIFLFLRRIQRDIIINVNMTLCKVPFIVVIF